MTVNTLLKTYPIYIIRDPIFNRNTLPKIDKLAIELRKTRSQVIRHILYEKTNYKPIKLTLGEIRGNAWFEQQHERANKNIIEVRVDTKFINMGYIGDSNYGYRAKRILESCDFKR